MNGMSLADVGACNGYFSFEARKRGARVVAFDIRHKDNSGFGLAQYINGLTDIEHHQINILDVQPGEHGPFDIVLAMGLLYHMPDRIGRWSIVPRCRGNGSSSSRIASMRSCRPIRRPNR